MGGWALPHQSLVKETPHRLSTGQSDGRDSSAEVPSPRSSSMPQTDKASLAILPGLMIVINTKDSPLSLSCAAQTHLQRLTFCMLFCFPSDVFGTFICCRNNKNTCLFSQTASCFLKHITTSSKLPTGDVWNVMFISKHHAQRDFSDVLGPWQS